MAAAKMLITVSSPCWEGNESSQRCRNSDDWIKAVASLCAPLPTDVEHKKDGSYGRNCTEDFHDLFCESEV
jgi:hypothetical protein